MYRHVYAIIHIHLWRNSTLSYENTSSTHKNTYTLSHTHTHTQVDVFNYFAYNYHINIFKSIYGLNKYEIRINIIPYTRRKNKIKSKLTASTQLHSAEAAAVAVAEATAHFT